MDEDPDIIEGFQHECLDMLDDIEPRLVALAEAQEAEGCIDSSEVNAIFRPFHTIKGCAGSLGFTILTKLGHEAETLLCLFRDRGYEYKSDYTEVLCEATDLLREIIEALSHGGEEAFESQVDVLAERLAKTTASIKEGAGSSDVRVEQERPVAQKNKLEKLDSPNRAPQKMNTQSVSEEPGDEDAAMVAQFTSDGADLLFSVEEALLSLQENPDQPEVLQHAYRMMHSFKGNCSLMEYDDMEHLSHSLESILLIYRGNTKPIKEEVTSVCLSSLDCLKLGLEALSENRAPKIDSLSILLELLSDYAPMDQVDKAMELIKPIEAEGEGVPADEELGEKFASTDKDNSQYRILVVDDSDFSQVKLKNLLEQNAYKVFCAGDGADALEMLTAEGAPVMDLVITDLAMPRMDGVQLVKKLNEIKSELPLIVMSGREDADMMKKLIGMELSGFINKNFAKQELYDLVHLAIRKGVKKKLMSSALGGSEDKKPIKSRNDIRVDMSKLDDVLNLVGELIIAEALVTLNPHVKSLKIESFMKASEQLKRIVTELHDVTLGLRMVPVEGVFKKMVRVVHDVSKKTGKKIKFETKGEDTELDKIVIDVLSDPLVHMLRNSADHGIEKPTERLGKRKPEAGTIELSAEQKGNEVAIVIKDDGAGISRERVLAKAVEKGMVDAGVAASMSDDDVFQFIFSPGFSTADQVTDVSGRGVGMDVVKKNIESVNGRIEIASKEGEGSIFTIRIPLNLATMQGILFRVGTSKYTIPISCIRESFCLGKEVVSERSDMMEYVKLRDEVLPIVRLHLLHDIEPDSERLEDGILIVLDVGEGRVCLFVDEMMYQMDTVIKNFSGYIIDLPTICGCNILGDGKVALILNADNIVRMLKQGLLKQVRKRKAQYAG